MTPLEMAATPTDRARQLVFAANLPRIGRIERQVRRLLIINKRMTTTELTRRIYRTTKPWQVGKS